MFFGFFAFIFWLFKIPVKFFPQTELQKKQQSITNLLPKIPKVLIPKRVVPTPDSLDAQELKSITVTPNLCVPTPQSLFENHIGKVYSKILKFSHCGHAVAKSLQSWVA